MIDVLGAVELPLQEAVSGCQPGHKRDVSPCLWVAMQFSREGLRSLRFGLHPSSLEPQAPHLEADHAAGRQVAQASTRVSCKVHSRLPQDDVRRSRVEVGRGCITNIFFSK